MTENRKDAFLIVRVTKEEKAGLIKEAKQKAKRLSDLIREKLLR